MQHRVTVWFLLLTLLGVFVGIQCDEIRPVLSSLQNDVDHLDNQSPSSFEEEEEEKRAWRDMNTGWGKRGWQDLQNGGWGKRGWHDLGNSGWGKRGWQDLGNAGWGKRAWRDLSSSGWGKRAWKDLSSGGWGKRGWQDIDAGRDLNFDDNTDSAEDKMLPLNSLREAWGKRSAADWQSFRGPFGKRDPAWNNLKGLWGKRNFDSSHTGLKASPEDLTSDD